MKLADLPLPDVADSVRDHAQVHGWDVDHHIHTRPHNCLVEHQLTFRQGATSVVAFWNANVEGDELPYPDFMLYDGFDLIERSSTLADLIGWFQLKAAS